MKRFTFSGIGCVYILNLVFALSNVQAAHLEGAQEHRQTEIMAPTPSPNPPPPLVIEEVNFDFDFSVSVYECDSDYTPLPSQVHTEAGSKINICIEAFSGTELQNFDLTLSNENNGYSYKLVSFGSNGALPYDSAITSISTQGQVTKVSSRVVYGLFTATSSSIKVFGSAYAISTMKDEDISDFVPFDLDIELLGIPSNDPKQGCILKLLRRASRFRL